MPGKNIFISFTHRELDEKLASSIYDNLKKEGHAPYMTTLEVRMSSSEISNTHKKLINSDYFVVILSERSLVSDLITEEIKTARELTDAGKMNIIPIAVNLTKNEIVNYDITGYLKNCNYLQCEEHNDIKLIVDEISKKIKHQPSDTTENEHDTADQVEQMHLSSGKQTVIPIPNAPLFAPGGNINFNASYYISRDGEQEFITNILNDGALLRIKGPRQYGKTSLLSRIIYFARENNHLVIPLSLQQIDLKQIGDLEKLFIQICVIATRKLKLKNKIKEFWDDEYLDVKMKCSSYFEEYLLEMVQSPIILAIDEADRVFDFPEVSNEFFSQLRYWHEERNFNPVWNKLKMVVSHSTEAYLAISEMNQSPFNVGIERNLMEFNDDEVALFAQNLGVTLDNNQLKTIKTLVGGHPYLVHVALYSIAKGDYSFNQFIKDAALDHGPFSDHLRRNLWFLSNEKELSTTFRNVIHKNSSENTLLTHKLRAAGLIKNEGNKLYPSFKLYEEYFKNKL